MKIKNHKNKIKPIEGNKLFSNKKNERPKTSDLEKAKKFKDDNPYEKMFI